MASWQYSDSLITSAVSCDECHGSLMLSDNQPAEVTLYTRHGTKFCQHYTKVCPNRWCRKKFMCGYTIKNEEKVYDTLNHKTVFLITSNETGFSIQYLYEATLHFLHSNATLQGLSDIYNQFHNFERRSISRNDLCDKRLASGFFLYSFLELTSRYQIHTKFKTGKNWIDEALLENQPKLKKVFSNIWSGEHECAFEDCASMMITDGNMKINRKVCSAKFSVVRKFEHSNKTVLTGCTAMPSPDSPFCAAHVKNETPVLLAENVTKETRMAILNYKAKTQTSNLKLPQDSVFIVESVLNSRKTNKNIEYLVQFAGCPATEACWEPIKNLPKFIVDYYEDGTKYGSSIPPPSIKHTIRVAKTSEVYHHLEWKVGQPSGRELELDNGKTLFDLDLDKLAKDEIRSTCNTRKVKDKRDRRHTAGIIIHAKPCGRIPHVDELFNCESITQVYGNVIEFLGNLSPDARDKIRIWLFDDMCHLKPFSEKKKQAKQNGITEQFSNLAKAVDKFHFPGHKKTDTYCQENCNPIVELKKLGITKQNTPACEQAFKWLNAFKNLKTMNEARFKIFLLYMIDLHNLHIANCVDLAANPLNEKRDDYIKKGDYKPIAEDDKAEVSIEEDIERVLLDLTSKLTVEDCKEEIFEDCFKTDSSGELRCNFCPGIYKREGHMRNHLESKHMKTFKIVCSCGKLFPDSTRLSRHRKTCK